MPERGDYPWYLDRIPPELRYKRGDPDRCSECGHGVGEHGTGGCEHADGGVRCACAATACGLHVERLVWDLEDPLPGDGPGGR